MARIKRLELDLDPPPMSDKVMVAAAIERGLKDGRYKKCVCGFILAAYVEQCPMCEAEGIHGRSIGRRLGYV